MLCDTSTGHLQPPVPREDHLLVFQAIHNMAHPGAEADLGTFPLTWYELRHHLLVQGLRRLLASKGH
jgi:hypothetical protein